ncbi:hypothetical protein PR048_026011 [Dryococelus australis]|uniref:Uncharacterized protein n=1 Tax=Dryococelus australis TaxID=614101 RepID=A0ABQ9GK67_9NEOP|nr:hypothetical protein PR048_026011 [Dryococelus australis]
MLALWQESVFICDQDLNELGIGVSRVGEKGIASLLRASTARNDSKVSQASGLTSLRVHTLCWKNYTRPGSIEFDVKRQHVASMSQPDYDGQPVTVRSSLPTFDFETKCLFFTEVIDEQFKERERKKPKERHRVVYDVRSLSLKDKGLGAASKRKVKWAEQVEIRLSTSKLIEKYGESVTAKDGRKVTICFIDTGINILNAWYENKKKNASEERLRIVETAAAIIRQDIQSHVYDKTTYPPGDNLLKDASTCVPTTLLTFLEKERKVIGFYFQDESPSLSSLNQNPHLVSPAKKMENKLTQLKKNGLTAMLWVLYLNLANLVKEYIHAERSVQDMRKLPFIMAPEEYEKFVNEGYFTMRRTNLFWTRVWSDLTTEKTLMRSMKSVGGLTRVRGATQCCKYVGPGPDCNSRHLHGIALSERFHRHAKVSLWFESPSPFHVTDKIMSITTGVVGDNTITCYDALAVGKQAMANMVGKHFTDVKLSRKDRALPLVSMTCSDKIYDDKVVIDPFLIFQGISMSKQTDDYVKTYLQNEWAPCPVALFDEAGMRKTKKSALYDIFEGRGKNIDLHNFDIVMDGGFLLHKVAWPSVSTCSTIYKATSITSSNITLVRVVLLFLMATPAQQKVPKMLSRPDDIDCRSLWDIHFGEDTEITLKQDHFLCNGNNKSRLISMPSVRLLDSGIKCRTASDDAGTLIVTNAINKYMVSDSLAVIGEDVHLVVLLTALTPAEWEILFVNPSHGKTKTKIYSSKYLQGLGLKNSISFIHAFTGCDTSAVFCKGKLSCFKLFKKHTDLQDVADVFNKQLLKKPPSTCTTNHSFTQSVSKAKPDISALLPTEGAARQHSFRVYHQVQLWLGNELPPELWGWGHKQNRLMPVTTEDPHRTRFYSKCHILQVYHWLWWGVTLDEVNEEVDDLEPLLEATDEDVNPEPSMSAVAKQVSRPSHQRKKQRIV